ncbi:MAG: glycosyltransferase [Elusimicrobia bacterium]|nr:glycosyltransferase [Elusimicrobiota bacterium]
MRFEMENLPKVSIIIVNHNTRDLLKKCLLSLKEGSEGIDSQVLVVDNGSVDGSNKMLQEEFPAIKLIANSENQGFAKANNQALQQMQGEYALLLNSDAQLKSGAVYKLYNFMLKNAKAGIVGPRLLNEDGTLQPSTYPPFSLWREFIRTSRLYLLLPRKLKGKMFLGTFWDHRQARMVSRLKGACIMVSKTAIANVGLLSEDFFFYGEIHDWCLRMWENGWEVWFCPDAEVIHIGSQTAQKKWCEKEHRLIKLSEQERLLSKHVLPLVKWLLFLNYLLSDIIGYIFRVFWKQSSLKNREINILKLEISWYANRFKETYLWFFWHNKAIAWFHKTRFYQYRSLLKLCRLFNIQKHEVKNISDEVFPLETFVKDKWQTGLKERSRTGMLDFYCARTLYFIVRIFKPEIVVETGVANGASSFFILSALESNKKGRLYSIDYPFSGKESFIPEGKEPGWIVPPHLRSRWTLELGKTSEKLKALLEKLGRIDVFFHDSEHTYNTMLFEYETAWKYLNRSGLLISDDVGFNDAFGTFVKRFNARYFVQGNRLGVAQK